jgi:hypothetical protein
MAEISYPFNGGPTTDAQYSDLFRYLTETGVVGVPGDANLKPTGDSTGLKVSVAPGFGVVRGHAYRATTPVPLAIDTGTAQARVDSIVMHLEYGTVNTVRLRIIKGDPSPDNPQPKTLVQTDSGIYQEMIGLVKVAPFAATITAADVVDLRRFTGSNPRRWTTDTRPKDAPNGTLGINVQTHKPEWLDGATWRELHTGILGIEQGGTGGTTVESARQNLGIFVQNASPAGGPLAGRVWIKTAS